MSYNCEVLARIALMAHVLVVEDDPIFSDTVVDLLSLALQCDVDVSVTGRDALSKLVDSKYELIMLDWQLPDMNGLDLLRKVLEISPGARVIMMTGIGDPKALESALDAGAEDILRKPFAAPQLLERVRLVLEQASK